MGWTLDRAEVTSGWRGVSDGRTAPTRREVSLWLRHEPTGVEVESTAVGPFTRAQAKDARERLWQELWPRLEDEVARKLRVSGR